MDVKSAFLYGTIEEEVYVCQPPSFEDPYFPDKVNKVEKASYGLHQAPRAWYETLSTYLLENGFRRGTIDKTLFIKKDKSDILLVQVYVDDIIFGSTKKTLCLEFEQMMHKRFQMSSMGELTFFLGLQVQQKEDGIFISQDKYVADILKKFDYVTVKTASTPMEPNKALVKDEEADNVDVHLYRSMIGSLMYLTASRPDITFVVCACARFQVMVNIRQKLYPYVCDILRLAYKLYEKNVTWRGTDMSSPHGIPVDLLDRLVILRTETYGLAEMIQASSFGYNLLWRKFPPTSFTGSPNMSDAGFDLLNKLLTHDPERRITADATLNHEWFREVPIPKSKDFMPTFPAQHAQDRCTRRVMKSPDPLEEQRRKELQHVEFGTAFVVEGQVKEKSKWFASLRDMARKLKLDLMAMEQSFLEANKFQEEVAQGYSKLPGVKVNFFQASASSFGYNLLWRKFPATSFTGSLSDAALNHEWFRKVPLPKYKDFMPTFPAQHAQDSHLQNSYKSNKIDTSRDEIRDHKSPRILEACTNDEYSLMKVIDFDLSDFVKTDQRLKDIVGSAYYVAPKLSDLVQGYFRIHVPNLQKDIGASLAHFLYSGDTNPCVPSAYMHNLLFGKYGS
ncbi:putative ribonuclease H-like domain-containing protein [Tanacetum coccineum]|uniref:Ribonuclease H-like domain-containing protein n=1 Tax=Tanacetum coccineum TaxID=301880 RepID=A0ABQ4XC27_9ASTR